MSRSPSRRVIGTAVLALAAGAILAGPLPAAAEEAPADVAQEPPPPAPSAVAPEPATPAPPPGGVAQEPATPAPPPGDVTPAPTPPPGDAAPWQPTSAPPPPVEAAPLQPPPPPVGEGAVVGEGQPSDVELAVRYRSASRMRVAGIVITSIGIAFSVAAVGFFAALVYGDSDEFLGELEWGVQGMGCAMWSAITLAIGIPLWAVGAYRRNRARREGFVAASMAPFLAPTPGGLVAGLRLASF